MFATLALSNEGETDENGEPIWWLNLKCDPDEAQSLRDIFPSVIPGYHTISPKVRRCFDTPIDHLVEAFENPE